MTRFNKKFCGQTTTRNAKRIAFLVGNLCKSSHQYITHTLDGKGLGLGRYANLVRNGYVYKVNNANDTYSLNIDCGNRQELDIIVFSDNTVKVVHTRDYQKSYRIVQLSETDASFIRDTLSHC